MNFVAIMISRSVLLLLAFAATCTDGFPSFTALSLRRPPVKLLTDIGVSPVRKRSRLLDGAKLEIELEANRINPPVTFSNVNDSSKRKMLVFAIPALGIYLANPLLSNIDNAFVGRTVGTAGLAALSPATICTDQMLYLFSFISRATTGLVSRAYASKTADDDESINGANTVGNVAAARDVASAPLTVSLICGFCITIFYALFTPNMLATLNVSPTLRPAASSYIYWRGAIAWAALAQSVCLSVMMATRDSVTPLKIIGLAASVNVVADALLCVWPFQWGCAGAAAATSFSTLLSCFFMLRALARKGILPSIRIPTKTELRGLLDYTGPLFAITLTRLGGFVAMQKTAMSLGHQALAGYQLCVNLLLFFLLFGEPLSQLSQTKLPGLLDKNDGASVLASLRSVSSLACFTSIGIASVSYAVARFGSGIFSADLAVQSIAQISAPSLFVAVAVSILAVAADGALMASRDFSFMLVLGLGTFLVQLGLLTRCTSVAQILGAFSLRLGTYAVAATLRMVLGYGEIGRSIRSTSRSIKAVDD